MKRDLLTGFLDFFWVPRVLGPARLAEDEVSNVDDTGNEVRCGLATLPTLDGFLVFHDPILPWIVTPHIEQTALIWQVLKVFLWLSAY